MMKRPNCQIIALEEHYWDRELAAQFAGGEGRRDAAMLERLYDVGALRLAEMDAAGVDVQLLSHGAPSLQKLGPQAVDLGRRVNDRLASAIAAHPTRFAGLAALPTIDPEAAAAELERCVTVLGLKGAMIHGLANGEFLDEPKFDPIWARAEALDVPIYLHPSVPHPQVSDVYYKKYQTDFPMVMRAAWGYTVETATIAIRMVIGGVFERFPRLKIVLGHLGETLPFLQWRIDQALQRPGAKICSFREVFSHNFYVTTSGNFSNPALLCCVMELGIDRVLFAIDYPFVANAPGVDWIATIPLCDEDKNKLLCGNARRLFRM